MRHFAVLLLLLGCTPDPAVVRMPSPPPTLEPPPPPRLSKRVRVIVALCDNANQGIVPVPAALGNGQNPATNLYWGAAYGVKMFFRRSSAWTSEVGSKPADPAILEQILFRSREFPVEVIAEAYDGARMATAIERFFREAAEGDSDLVCFVGHNGLMDRPLGPLPAPGRTRPKGAVVLACKSRDYFAEPLRRVGCPPLVTTSGFMAPEAYVLDAIVRKWAAGAEAAAMAVDAGAAYATYQRCSPAAARKLFVAAN